MKKRTKKLLVIALSTMMLMGAALSVNAASAPIAYCPNGSCGAGTTNGTYYRECSTCAAQHKDNPSLYRYTCGRCGNVFVTCASGHYQ